MAVRIGTRGSPLARWQADWVANQLEQHGFEVEIVTISTQGDRDKRGTIGSLGSQGVFTKEIQRALLDNDVDVSVHSLKDLPTDPTPGLTLAAVPKRGPVHDVFLCRKASSLSELPAGAVVGTGSLRRRSQLLYAREDLVVSDIRGNVETRLAKLDRGEFDALVLAQAGLQRLKLDQHITQPLSTEEMLPAVGQGALGIEIRDEDQETLRAVLHLNHEDTHAAVRAERSLLSTLRGGCLAPIGALGSIEGSGKLKLIAVVLNPTGTSRLWAECVGSCDNPEQLGQQLAQELLSQGAAALIAESRQPD